MSSKTKTTATTKEEATSSLVPKLRFPEFRKAARWQVMKLNVLLFEAKHRNRTLELGPSDVLSVSGEYGCVNQIEYMGRSYAGVTVKDYHVVEHGDMVYTKSPLKRNPYGIIKENKGKRGIVSTLYAVYRPYPGCSATYLQHFFSVDYNLNAYLQPIVKKGAKNDMKVNNADVLKGDICAPKLPEQQKIAECLSSVDELMSAQARKLDALKTHKKGLMQQLFPREGETQPRLRFPEFQNAGEWVLTSVGGLVEANTLFPPKDGNHGNIHPKSADYVAQGIPFIMASDLNGGLIDIETCHFISKDQADTLQKGFAKEGDVLLSHKGTVGEVAVVRKIHTPYLMLTPQVTYYRVKDPKKLSNEFLAQLFFSDTFQSNLLELSGGGTRSYIGITEQAKLRMQFPKNVAEQQRIASCLTSLDDLIAAQTQKLEALKTHKKGLMQQLFPSPEALS